MDDAPACRPSAQNEPPQARRAWLLHTDRRRARRERVDVPICRGQVPARFTERSGRAFATHRTRSLVASYSITCLTGSTDSPKDVQSPSPTNLASWAPFGLTDFVLFATICHIQCKWYFPSSSPTEECSAHHLDRQALARRPDRHARLRPPIPLRRDVLAPDARPDHAAPAPPSRRPVRPPARRPPAHRRRHLLGARSRPARRQQLTDRAHPRAARAVRPRL